MIVGGQLVILKGLVGFSYLTQSKLKIPLTTKGGHNFHETMGNMEVLESLARLDGFYTPLTNGFGLWHTTYFIHGYSAGYDYSLV